MSAQASKRQRGIALMRIARALPEAVLALAIGFCGGCSGPGEAGSDATPVSEDRESLMNEYIQLARQGDFGGAWRSHGRLFEDARRSGATTSLIASYCTSSAECPAIGHIGWILGKSKADLAYMDDWDCRAHAPNFSCKRWDDWVHSNIVYLGETASQSPPPAQEVDIFFVHAETYGDLRPWTLVKIGDQAIWALLDSGGYSVHVSKDLKTLIPDFIEFFGKPFRHGSPLGTDSIRQYVVLRDFVLGTVIEERMPAVATDDLPQTVVVVRHERSVALFPSLFFLGNTTRSPGQPWAMRQCGDIDSGRRIERRRAIHDSGSVGVRRANSSRGGYRGAAIAVPGRVHRANGRQALPIRTRPGL